MEGSEGSAEERSEWETASGGSEKEGTGDCAKAAGLGAYATRPEWRDVNPLRQASKHSVGPESLSPSGYVLL